MLEDLSHLATIFGLPVALGALIYAGVQLHSGLKVAKGQFILDLKQMLDTHRVVHRRLRPGEIWHGADGQLPATAQEWCDLEEYMGFFEHCEILIQDGSLDLDNFIDMFSYRVHNIVSNPKIVEAKLTGPERASWELFLKLCNRLKIRI